MGTDSVTLRLCRTCVQLCAALSRQRDKLTARETWCETCVHRAQRVPGAGGEGRPVERVGNVRASPLGPWQLGLEL